MRIGIAQLNPTVGDLSGNRRLVEEVAAKAASERVDLLVLPEMVLTGYPPMDLLERDGFVRDQLRELDALLPASENVSLLLGAVLPAPDRSPQQLSNAAVLLAGGRRIAERAKSLLPTYDVFDEKRYFAAALRREPVILPGREGEEFAIGVTICEDTLSDEIGYPVDPAAELARDGVKLIANLSASPWHVGRAAERRAMLTELATRHQLPVAFANQVGGNDELVFDGGSFVCDTKGRVIASLPLFETAFVAVDLEAEAITPVADPDDTAQLEAGLVLGIRDYFRKQELPPGAVIGLSGGVDSAVTAHLATLALGPDRVIGIAMPGPFSSEHSVTDALSLGHHLGIEVRSVDITPIYDAYLSVFRELFGKKDDFGIAQQNIQSRIRGAVTMAISNTERRLVLATGNKSELSVGYCTLYGDTVGGLAVLGDVYKRDVYALARRANRDGERIPWNTIDKPPSAELAADQLDSDDLPDYEVLDAILEQAVEGKLTAARIAPPQTATEQTVREVLMRIDRNEYKRHQAPLVLRTSRKAFGSGRRLPIVHQYR